ncbi:hypothetical protein D8S78_04790 [Natrialba swarupiae]|nr:hypothetical protein [Natrialba swarupiae]
MVAVPWIAYAFVLVVAAAAVFVRYATITDGVYRWQALALAGVVLMGTAADVLYFLPVPPTGFAITPGYPPLECDRRRPRRPVRLRPSRPCDSRTRAAGTHRMELGMVVLDADGRVIDVNRPNSWSVKAGSASRHRTRFPVRTAPLSPNVRSTSTVSTATSRFGLTGSTSARGSRCLPSGNSTI